jgi:hypothetical protein
MSRIEKVPGISSVKTSNILLSLLFLASTNTFAATAGNIANFPEKGKLTAGYEYTKVENRDIIEYDGGPGALWVVDFSERNLGKISYGVKENIALDFLFGEAALTLEAENAPGDPGMKFDKGNTWGLGIRLKLFDDPQRNLTGGAGVQYRHFCNDNAVRYNKKDPFSSKSEEWHLSLDMAKKIKRFSLYGAVRYSESTIPYTHAGPPIVRIGGFKERNNFGIAVGGEIKFTEGLSLCLEKRFVDEDAYTLGIYLAF